MSSSRIREVVFDPGNRLVVVRITAALMIAAQLLLYRSIWFDRAFPAGPPTLPLVRWLPSLPEPGGLILWVFMIAACAVAIVGWQARWAARGVAAGYVIMVILDQTRWQPHFLIGPVMLLIATLPAPTPRDSLRNVRLALSSVYFFAGLGKLNICYMTLVHADMLRPMIEHVPGFIGSLLAIAWVVPLSEMAVGVAAFSPGRWRTRRFALVAAIGMHAFIITLVVLAGDDLTVVPFNLGLAVLAIATLCDDADPIARPHLRSLFGHASGVLAFTYAILVPALSLIGLADMSLAHAYYAGNEARIRWYASAAAAERLVAIPWDPTSLEEGALQPGRTPPGTRPVGDGHMFAVPFHGLTNLALHQAIVGEARMAERVKDRLCEYAAREPNDIIVRFFGVANPITGDRPYRDANCDETLGLWLRFGGFHTVVLGGDQPVYDFEQHGKPKF